MSYKTENAKHLAALANMTSDPKDYQSKPLPILGTKGILGPHPQAEPKAEENKRPEK